LLWQHIVDCCPLTLGFVYFSLAQGSSVLVVVLQAEQTVIGSSSCSDFPNEFFTLLMLNKRYYYQTCVFL
jgi:hypothetical protein